MVWSVMAVERDGWQAWLTGGGQYNAVDFHYHRISELAQNCVPVLSLPSMEARLVSNVDVFTEKLSTALW